MFDSVANGLFVRADPFGLGETTFQGQGHTRFAALPGGGFVAVWGGQDGFNNPGVFIQRFDNDGKALGPSTILNTVIAGMQGGPAISVLANGGFVVTWGEESAYPAVFDIKAQIFDAAGSKIGGEFIANSTTEGFQTASSVVGLADGKFVIAWENALSTGFDDIRGQLYAANGARIGGEFILTDDRPGDKLDFSLTALSGGGFVGAWYQSGAELNVDAYGNLSDGTRVQLFDASGSKVGAASPLNSYVPGNQQEPVLTALPDGGFVGAWVDGGPPGRGIWLQRFDAAGQRVGAELKVNSLAWGQTDPIIEVVPGHGFVVIWKDNNQTADNELTGRRGQLFSFSGDKIGAEFALTPGGLGAQNDADVIALHDGSLVVGWTQFAPPNWNEDVRAQILYTTIQGTAGADTIIGDDNRDFINGGAGNDIMSGLHGNDSLSGGDGDDTLYGDDGDDVLDGGAGNDQLFGGAGNDRIEGLAGADRLTGGAGNDTFQDTAANFNGDTITDFAVGDRIVFSNATMAGFSFSLSGSTLTYTGGSLTLADLPPGRLVATAAAGGGVELSLATGSQAVWRAGDFNGDGRSDILWRHVNGTVTDWLGQANGGFAGNFANANLALTNDWQVAGTGDFNGDGRSDIVWRHVNGTVTDWLGQANGGFAGNFDNANLALTNDWQIAGTGDFDGDRRSDILWRNANGTVTDWLGQSNGGFAGNFDNANLALTNDWQIAQTGDFNGDGRSDILWRHVNGTVTNWLGQTNGGFIGNFDNANLALSNDWQVAGTGDFNGDGREDVLWRHVNGTVTDWLGQTDGGFAGNFDNANLALTNDWQVAATGDYNGDGRDDILWRHVNGTVTDWLGTANGGFAGNFDNANLALTNDWQVQPGATPTGQANGAMTDRLGQANDGFAEDFANAKLVLTNDWRVQMSDVLL